jgi:hypothetical protein
MTFVPFNLYSYQTGLRLEAQPTDASDPPVALGPPLAAGFTEFGNGAYGWTVQPLPAGTQAVEIRQQNSSFTFTGTVLSLADMGLQFPTNGGGAFKFTITVEDNNSGFTLLPSVAVSMTQGSTVLQSTTNASGVATFNVGPGVWTIAAYLPGYSYSGSSVTVSGNGNQTIQLNPNYIPTPPSGNQLTGWLYTQIPGTTIYYAMTIAPLGSGMQLDGTTQYHTSDSSGLWAVPLYLGATYTFNCGNGPTNTILIPNSGTTLELQNLLSL